MLQQFFIAELSCHAGWPKARESGELSEHRKTEHPQLRMLCLWIPAATYSSGPSPAKYHRRMKA